MAEKPFTLINKERLERSGSPKPKSIYVDSHGNLKTDDAASIIINSEQEMKEKLYRKATKIYKMLIQSQFCVFSKDNTIFDLLVKDESELALLTNYRISETNLKLQKAKNLYKNIMKK